MFNVGDHFQSKSALTRCLNTAYFDENTGKVVIDKTALKPQAVNNNSIGKQDPVFYDGKCLGRFDLRNNEPGRALSIWEITNVKVDGSGCGDSHNISGNNTKWGRYEVTAKRVNIDGNPHKSGEILHFSNVGCFTVTDYQAVKLPVPD